MRQTLPELSIKEAEAADVSAVTLLINRAYRGESSRAGWTTEADLLGGLRIDEAGITDILKDNHSFLLLVFQADTVVASIHARVENDGVHFGLFAVEPALQGKGIGKRLLEAAETKARKKWGVKEARMEVIALRSELIAFYARHGYKKTGETIPFPLSPLWQLRGDALALAVLKKDLG